MMNLAIFLEGKAAGRGKAEREESEDPQGKTKNKPQSI